MKVLFLDFDGVLHPARQDLPQDERFVWLPLLTKALESHPDVMLAVHSTWRYDHTLDELRTLLGPLGGRLLAVTPRGQREDSIQWLAHALGTMDFLVLDDEQKDFRELPPTRLLFCEPALGLSERALRARLAAWLANEGDDA